MGEYETYYNTPSFGKDTECEECPRCEGDGWLYTGGTEDGQAEKETCPCCKGTGEIEITD